MPMPSRDREGAVSIPILRAGRAYESIEKLYIAFKTGREGPYLQETAALNLEDLDKNKKIEITDAWRTPFRYTHSQYYTADVDGPEGMFLIESAGPDEEFGTADDIKSWKKPG